MKSSLYLFIVFLCTGCYSSTRDAAEAEPETAITKPILIIHGGAGSISRDRINDSLEQVYHAALTDALNAGYSILNSGGTSLEAVEATIVVMEDHPLFNAGRGSVVNSLGMVENDASIMDGSNLDCGAVAGVQNVKNPISLARLIKDSTVHVMLSGTGAREFAESMNMEIVDQSWFITEKRKAQWERIRKMDKKGTVGCVALDKNGNLAAGTSTGGMMMKKWGRIGDSPVIGAGTYADNEYAGVSCTGHGEYFIKNSVAYDLIARMKYNNVSVDEAAQSIIHGTLKDQEALGGLIALDRNGNFSFQFNTNGMFRGVQSADTLWTGMFK